MPLSRPPPLSAGISSLEHLHAYAYGEGGHLPPLKAGSMLLKQGESPGGPRPPEDSNHHHHHHHHHHPQQPSSQSNHQAGNGQHLPSLSSSGNSSLQNLAVEPVTGPSAGHGPPAPLLASGHASLHHSRSNSQSSSPLVQPAASKSERDSQQSQQQQQQQQQQPGANPAASVKPKPMTVTPDIVMKLYMNKLTPYEHHEIFNYPQIYFIGANAKKRSGIIGMPNNNDYDNDKGSYIHITHDHVAYRYEVLKVIGKGSFGQVVKAYDHKNHEHVALKMVRNEERFHRQAQEEIRILRNLREQDKDNTMNVIHMFDSFTFRNHMCITFELLSINLYELIKKNKFQGFSLQLVRKFSHSLLQCLDALHKNKIIHCDMKPENVLLKQQGRSGIKVRRSFFLPALTRSLPIVLLFLKANLASSSRSLNSHPPFFTIRHIDLFGNKTQSTNTKLLVFIFFFIADTFHHIKMDMLSNDSIIYTNLAL